MNGSYNTPECWALRLLFKIDLVREATAGGPRFSCRSLMAVGFCFCWGKDCEVKKDACVTGFVFPTLLGLLTRALLVKLESLFFHNFCMFLISHGPMAQNQTLPT